MIALKKLSIIVVTFLYIVISDPLKDPDSPEFRALAKSTYAKVIPCVETTWMLSGKKINWEFPKDAQYHFEEIRNKTSPYRTAPVHEYAGYEGPWIENIFIAKYLHKPLTHFRGLIPIFIQWIDNQILRGRYFDYIHSELNSLLRPNVLYLAISQGDVGLGKIGRSWPNILVLSAGGFGHVPIPLVKGEIKWSPQPPEFAQDMAFFGTVQQSSRPEILKIIKDAGEARGMKYKQGYGSSWKEDMEHTKFNLAPRGYGRSSFRFAESIQMGRIPVFLYNDVPWVPYLGSALGIETYGFLAGKTSKNDTLVEMVDKLHKLTKEEYSEKLRKLEIARYYFTYHGVLYQIEEFLHDPFGPEGGFLRCTPHPHTERCCD